MKNLRLWIGFILLAAGGFYIIWFLHLTLFPEFYATDSEELRLLKLGREAMFTELDGLLQVFDMLAMPILSVVTGLVLFRPPLWIRSIFQRAVAEWKLGKGRIEQNDQKTLPTPVTSGARLTNSPVGSLLITVGLALIIYALFMDVSVDTSYGAVANLNLIADRQLYLILGGFTSLAGLVIFLRSSRDRP